MLLDEYDLKLESIQTELRTDAVNHAHNLREEKKIIKMINEQEEKLKKNIAILHAMQESVKAINGDSK